MSEESEAANCFICHKHALGEAAQGGVLHDDGLLYAGHLHALDGPTAYRGWLMIEPKRHVAGLAELNDDEAAALGLLTSRLARLLRHGLGAEHVYAFVLGDRVPHLHVHLAPRYPGTPPEFRGLQLSEWPDAPTVTEPEMRALIGQLRPI